MPNINIDQSHCSVFAVCENQAEAGCSGRGQSGADTWCGEEQSIYVRLSGSSACCRRCEGRHERVSTYGTVRTQDTVWLSSSVSLACLFVRMIRLSDMCLSIRQQTGIHKFKINHPEFSSTELRSRQAGDWRSTQERKDERTNERTKTHRVPKKYTNY